MTDKPKTAYDVGREYYVKGNNKLAIENYSKFIIKNPHSSKAYFARGEAHRMNFAYQEAIQDYKVSMKNNFKYELKAKNSLVVGKMIMI
jgi:tetratricopeptide (TPR) repeat protein